MGEEPIAVRPVDPLASDTPPAEDPAAIRAEIEETRAEMSDTIDALQEKLSPQRIMDEAKQTVHDATVGKVTTMMNTVTEKVGDVGAEVQDQAQYAASYVRENPMPALLIGAGVAWLLLRSRGSGRSTYSGYSGYSGTTRYPVRRTNAPTSGAAPGWTDKASDAAGRVQHTVSAYGRSAETTLERWLRENPLTVGTVALAAGSLVGLSLPRTETEDAWMGDARDTVVERVQETAQSAVERVGELADQVQQSSGEVSQVAAEVSEQLGDTSSTRSSTSAPSGTEAGTTSGEPASRTTGASRGSRTTGAGRS
jgi:ElaB/YqjD/DUF883 family membrane-anchored ribosome-binding protein